MFNRLKELREDNDLSQKSISSILNITRQNYSRWETNEKIIPLKHLVSLCNYYKVSLDYITGLNNKNNYNQIIIDKKLIGTRLKKFRKNNKITQTDLAIFFKYNSFYYMCL